MPKVRDAHGGGYESRGRFHMRVTIAPQTRPSKLLPWCTSLEDARTRAGVVQEYVNRLRTAGQLDFIERVTPKADGKAPLTFRKFAEQWTGGDLHTLYPDHVPEKRTADDDKMRLG